MLLDWPGGVYATSPADFGRQRNIDPDLYKVRVGCNGGSEGERESICAEVECIWNWCPSILF